MQGCIEKVHILDSTVRCGSIYKVIDGMCEEECKALLQMISPWPCIRELEAFDPFEAILSCKSMEASREA